MRLTITQPRVFPRRLCMKCDRRERMDRKAEENDMTRRDWLRRSGVFAAITLVVGIFGAVLARFRGLSPAEEFCGWIKEGFFLVTAPAIIALTFSFLHIGIGDAVNEAAIPYYFGYFSSCCLTEKIVPEATPFTCITMFIAVSCLTFCAIFSMARAREKRKKGPDAAELNKAQKVTLSAAKVLLLLSGVTLLILVMIG